MMNYSYLNNIELEKALNILLNAAIEIGAGQQAEKIPVREACGRVTSEAVYARISSPHYNASAMDGIAVCARSTFGATDTTPVVLQEGKDYKMVDTGDPLPSGFDAVVMIEDVINLGDGTVKLLKSAVPWQHVRQIGEDICAGDMILPSNTVIEPATIGAMLAGGIQEVWVWKRPLAGIIPTGDEIVPPGGTPEEGKIMEFNSSIFSSMLSKWNAVSKVYDIVPDNIELIKGALLKAASECDIVLINAGSSAGRDDYTARAISELGTLLVHGIAIRPGKPTVLGLIKDKPVIGVPGYPVSGIIVLEKLVKPLIEYYNHYSMPEGQTVKAVLSKRVVSSLKYEEFVRVKLGSVDDRIVAVPLNRGAGVVTSFVKADGLLHIPMNSEGFEGGQTVNVQLLKREDEIKNTLVVTGSHDPLLDVMSDIMQRTWRGEYISSSHVGSMGGIMAVKRSEAHMAGIHLLDEETGEYNISYIRKYFPDRKIILINCVKRIQGLMVKPGNPMGIKGISDLARPELKYVNRQKGAGTRILLDFLLRKHGINASDIYGYDREEFTHMSVAALVASDSADAGMGIYSAAKIYGLDFIPVCEEQYDFILPEKYMDMKLVKHFIEILKSDEFRNTLQAMGGYNTDNAGSITVL
ncbi:MAG TPA: molybdopterin biosynthesis protein [Clostridiaceae bacterium]|nr:molybdopterin biosynthesis protein [Clostridiaceae bacterium]